MLKHIFYFIGFIFISLSPMFIVSIMIDIGDNTMPILTSFICLLILFLFLLILNFLYTYYKKISRNKFKKIYCKNIINIIIMFIGMRFIFMILKLLLEFETNDGLTKNDETLISLESTNLSVSVVILFAITIMFISPICEELIYRGIFHNMFFKKNILYVFPSLISSFIFSLLHAPTNIVSFLIYFLASLILYYAYIRRDNILESIILHILNNSIYTYYLILNNLF